MFPVEAQSSPTACPRLHSPRMQSPDLSLEMIGSKAYILPIPGHPLQSSQGTHRPLTFQNKQERSVVSILSQACHLCSCETSVFQFLVHQAYLRTWLSLSLDIPHPPPNNSNFKVCAAAAGLLVRNEGPWLPAGAHRRTGSKDRVRSVPSLTSSALLLILALIGPGRYFPPPGSRSLCILVWTAKQPHMLCEPWNKETSEPLPCLHCS